MWICPILVILVDRAADWSFWIWITQKNACMKEQLEVRHAFKVAANILQQDDTLKSGIYDLKV